MRGESEEQDSMCGEQLLKSLWRSRPRFSLNPGTGNKFAKSMPGRYSLATVKSLRLLLLVVKAVVM